MFEAARQFAVETEASGGLGALGLNVESFLFQLITFVIALLLLRKFVYGKLVDTLEGRRKAVLDGLKDAQKATESLQKAGEETARLLTEARKEADGIVATANKEAAVVIETAETKAVKKAEHIVASAEQRMEQELTKARLVLRKETLELVAQATEIIIRKKLDDKADADLIQAALRDVK